MNGRVVSGGFDPGRFSRECVLLTVTVTILFGWDSSGSAERRHGPAEKRPQSAIAWSHGSHLHGFRLIISKDIQRGNYYFGPHLDVDPCSLLQEYDATPTQNSCAANRVDSKTIARLPTH